MCSNIGYSKEMQTKKAKKLKKGRMTKSDLSTYQMYIYEDSLGLCQLCHKEPIDDYHHSKYGCYGADKDDKFLIGLCRTDHDLCHKDKQKNNEALYIAQVNWKNAPQKLRDKYQD